MFVEGQWLDNARTVSGNIVHKLVDDPFFNEKRKTLVVVRSLPIFHDGLNMHGIADCVEFKQNPKGAYIPQLNGNYTIQAIEYKNGKPLVSGSINIADKMQLAAQMMCLNYMFSTESTGCIFYHATGRRVLLTDPDEAMEQVKTLLSNISKLTKEHIVPQKPQKQNCNNCSMENVCMPKTVGRLSQKDRIIKAWEAEYA